MEMRNVRHSYRQRLWLWLVSVGQCAETVSGGRLASVTASVEVIRKGICLCVIRRASRVFVCTWKRVQACARSPQHLRSSAPSGTPRVWSDIAVRQGRSLAQFDKPKSESRLAEPVLPVSTIGAGQRENGGQ